MAKRKPPVAPSILAADHATVAALKELPDYQPTNPEYSLERILALQAQVFQIEQAELAAEHALAQIRASKSDVSHADHESVVGGRVSTVVQYGPDSYAASLVGLTRKSERKQPKRKGAAG